MQLRHVAYFVALAREGHFGRAAQACGVTQPTLSAGIGALEATLGNRLVLRDRRFVDLTAEGHAALPWAQQMLSDYDALKRSGSSVELTGCLTIGVIPAAMPSVGAIPPVLALNHPHLEMKFLSMTSRQIERGLFAHELDAGVTYLENEPLADVINWTFYHEQYLFATPADGPFAGRRSIAWREVGGMPLALLTPDMQNRRILDAQLAKAGVEVLPHATANSYMALLSMVRLGGLSCILPHVHAEAARLDPRIAVLSFSDPSPPQAVGLVVLDRHPMAPMTRAILACVRSAEFRRCMLPLREASGAVRIADEAAMPGDLSIDNLYQ